MPKKKHLVQILQEYEAATYETLEPLFPRMHKLGFKYIVSHRAVPLIHPNAIYIFAKPSERGCKFSTTEELEDEVVVPVRIADVQAEFYGPMHQKRKGGKLAFKAWDSGEMIGLYNEVDNVLWISDITHIGGELTLKPLILMLTILEKYKELPRPKFRKWKRRWEKVEQFPQMLMGADPEFELVDGEGRIVSAATVWPDSAYCDKKIGHDGDAQLGEFRPDPKKSPIKLTEEFGKLIKEIHDEPAFPADGKMFVGGGVRLRVGGHIHISGVEPTENLLDLIGCYMAEPMRRSMQNLSGRKENHYGRWTARGNSERIRWNGPDHWEYRPFMAYHLDRKTTNAVHCTFFCLIETWRRDPGRLFQPEARPLHLNEALGVGERPKPSDYKQLLYYKKYAAHIDLFVHKFVKGSSLLEGQDALDNWLPHRSKKARLLFGSVPEEIMAGFKIDPKMEALLSLLKKMREPPLKGGSRRINVLPSYNGQLLYYGLHAPAVRELMKRTQLTAYSDRKMAIDNWGRWAWRMGFGITREMYRTSHVRTHIAKLLSTIIRKELREFPDVYSFSTFDSVPGEVNPRAQVPPPSDEMLNNAMPGDPVEDLRDPTPDSPPSLHPEALDDPFLEV